MKRSINAALLGRFAVVGAVVCTGIIGFSCSPAGKDSTVSGGNGSGAASAGGSSATGGGTGGSKTGGPDLGPDVPGMTPAGACQGLECQVQACTAGVTTSISGKVFAPNGTLPLYNVLVYVPNTAIAPVPAFTPGAACDRCGATVTNPVTSAITDETGSFRLDGAPAGQNIPLVIQVGKWRRQLTIPAVMPCVDTPLTDPQLTRLPKNKTEGDIPLIAIAAGGADQMECLPRRLGIEDAEFTTPTGTGRLHLYSSGMNNMQPPINKFDTALNAGAALPPATELWANQDALMKYDIVILSCEGNQGPQQKPMAAREALYDYASAGGRVFASHWHNIWFADGPQVVQTTGTWRNREDPTQNGAPLEATVNTSFPKGQALANWLVNVGASTTAGQLTVTFPRDNLQAVNAQVAREWITVQSPRAEYASMPTAVQYMSFNTPIGVPEEQVCGRAVYTNLHVSATASLDGEKAGFPANCEMRELSAQEKAVAFMLFDLSACVMNDDLEPEPPH